MSNFHPLEVVGRFIETQLEKWRVNIDNIKAVDETLVDVSLF